jgi:hypothetical protein
MPPRFTRSGAPSGGTATGRRSVLLGLAAGGLLSALGVARADPADDPSAAVSAGATVRRTAGGDRLTTAFRVRRDAALSHLVGARAAAESAGDGPDPYAAFTKGLPHDADGDVDPAALDALSAALAGEGDFEAVPLGGERRLVNPEAALSYNLSGADPHHLPMPPAPAFADPESAAEMVELYWQALLRDVPLDDLGRDPLAARAAAELAALPGYDGPRAADGSVPVGSLFRGTLPGDDVGPHVSQFLLVPVPEGDTLTVEQRYRVLEPGSDHLTDYDSWLACQNGAAPTRGEAYADGRRYLTTGRDLATHVHRDFPYATYLRAALVLLGWGAPFDRGNPLADSTTQAPFVDFGGNDVLDLVAAVTVPVQHANWCHKWLVHRRLRPETYGGRVHRVLTDGAAYPIPAALLDAEAVAVTRDRFGTALLPQAYPEGSPLHPSYPAGHAGIAGAAVTVLKAYFDGSWVLPDPVAPSGDGTTLVGVDAPLTVTGELNKLASNVSIGRNWAGIHYRSDAADGLRLGEQVAIGLLADRARTYAASYDFDGFELTTFDGERVRVTPDGAVPA